MNITLRYVPPIKGSFLTLILISFFFVVLVLYIAFVKLGIIVIILFTVFYSLLMVFVFYSLSRGHYIELIEDKNSLVIHRTFKSVEIGLDIIDEIELVDTKRAYLLSITTKDNTKDYSLSGSLSFEEPPFMPFLRKVQALKPHVKFGPFCQATVHGSSNFNPWSSKMYFAYWTYIIVMVLYYLGLLLTINILK